MKQSEFTVIENKSIAPSMYRMRLSGDASGFSRPGQFANVKLEGFFLRRPISVCDYDESGLTLIYKTVGRGTECMSRLESGARLDILTGLGNGFDTAKSGESPLLVAGGSGVPPMLKLAKTLVSEGKRVKAALGFNSAKDVYIADELERLGVELRVATMDGSRGIKGVVTDAIAGLEYSFFYACGSMPMYNALRGVLKTGGQYSFEERMGCGFGACMGCSMLTKGGSRRVCKDGPVFDASEIIWEGQE